jgi:antitoxin ParD1/3/4
MPIVDCDAVLERGSERTPMPTRNVVLTEGQQELIETLVESGRYQNASEVLRYGLRLVEQREAEDATKLKPLREAARIGVSALNRGEFKEFENAQDLEAYLNKLSEKIISRTAE